MKHQIQRSFFLLGTMLGAALGAAPLVSPVSNFPSGISQVWSAQEGPSGWVVATDKGYVTQQGSRWVTTLSPAPHQSNHIALPFPNGNVLIAGEGSAWLHTAPDRWQRLAEGNYYSGILLSRVALLGASNGYLRAYDDAGRELQSVQVKPGPITIFPRSQTTAQVYLSDSVYLWDGREFTVQTHNSPSGEVVLATPNMLATDKSMSWRGVDFSAPWREVLRDGVVGLIDRGNTCFYATYIRGLGAWDQAATQLWAVPVAQLPGNPYFLRTAPNGNDLVLGAGGQFCVLPDPSLYSYRTLPKGDLLFSTGGYLGVVGTVFDPQGEPLSRAWGTAAAVDASGLYLGAFSLVSWPDGRITQLPVRSDFVLGMEPFAHGLALLLRDHVVLLSPTDNFLELDVKSANSITVQGDALHVGTTTGVQVFDEKGRPIRRYGTGACRVANGYSFSDTGQVYDVRGEACAPLHLPVLDTVVGPYTVALCSLPNGDAWVGAYDPHKGWQPFDLPLTFTPARVAFHGDELLVAASGHCLTVRQRPALLAQPPVPQLPASITIPDDQDIYELQLPSGRLGPWPTARYTVVVGDSPGLTASAGDILTVPRVPRGTTALRITATWANLTAVTTSTIQRPIQIWLRWPALTTYAFALVGISVVAVRLRTRVLQQRAAHLERLVTQRTHDLINAQRAREDFFSTVSHEIRNPLNGVVGLITIMDERNSLAGRDRVHFTNLRSCADQLRSILDDILDFSRIDRGDIQLHPEGFDIYTAVHGAVSTVDITMGKSHISCPVTGWVSGDVGKFRQIITNLTTNAHKYGTPSFADLTVTIRGREVEVMVRNQGPVIPPEELERIFSGFVRGRDAVQRRILGSGIGLAVSRRLARAMGGDLTGRSDATGTAFTLTVTLQPSERPVELPTSPVPTVSRALGIEDEAYNRIVMTDLLGKLGYSVDWAVDGANALRLAQENGYDLVVTDFCLPDTDGAELVPKLRALLPLTPVIAVTAYSTPERRDEAQRAGVMGFVSKPVSLDKLKAAISGMQPMSQLLNPMPVEPEGEFSRLLKYGIPVAQFMADLAEDWRQCEELLPSPTAVPVLHHLRSTLAVLPAKELMQLVDEMEEAARHGKHDTLTRLLPQVREAVRGLIQRAAERSQA